MKFKSEKEEQELAETSLILRLIAKDLDSLMQSFGKEAIITRVLSAVSGESGVHLDKRAFDVRNEHEGVRLFSDPEVSLLVDRINLIWARNDGHPTMMHHSFLGGPLHFHVQIPISTKAYEKQTRTN